MTNPNQAPQNIEISFTPEQVAQADSFFNELHHAYSVGQMEAYMDEQLAIVEREYEHNPGENAGLYLIASAAAAGGRKNNEDAQTALDKLARLPIFFGDDETAIALAIRQTQYEKSEPGLSAEQAAANAGHYLWDQLEKLDAIDGNLDRDGRNIPATKLVLAAAGVGAAIARQDYAQDFRARAIGLMQG